ncbi:Site-specific recombinase XerD [Brevibacterium aurantiacum]|uniref:Site-specific recombinase XerD n=1 Tax=Brevibacterium aurantiacum TaxID=273384 RepID=A0A2H1KAC8_BREAU|nr:tyrosine-type recombinase/integrase [Brevibacterium aurantiacum]SMX96721.1 Site-specific recombinase XerD [Brevibacterium aurantiacum]
MHLMTDYRESLTAFRLLPSASNVSLVKPEQQVYGAMMSGWENQQLSRGLRQQTIDSRTAIVSRFHEFIDKPPWKWTVADVDEFTADAAGRSLTLSTLRQNHGAIRTFCDYITSPLYDWMEICDHQFGEVPSQVCLPWNTVAHRFEFEGDGKRRPLSYEEVERLFDTADARVDKLALSGRKGALGALRDAQLLKTIYAFGLRRTEAVMLDTVDLHYSSKMRHWGRYGALHVRWAKAAGGGAPRRRTVLLVPEFDWWVPGMRQWNEQARARFAPGGDLDALWVTERRTRVSAGYLDRRFADLRDEAGLSKALTLHSLRHSYVTHLLEFGYADRFVQDQVGHMHASTTSIYASVSSDYKNRVLAEALKTLTEGEADDH